MWIAMVAAFVVAQAMPEPPATHERDPVLDAYLLEAADNHPALAQRYEEWQAALAVIPQVTSLDDPRFRYGQVVTRSMGRAQFELMQEFPWFGTRAAKGNAAAESAEAALHNFYAERDAVFFGVRRWYHEYRWLADQTRVLEAQQTVLDYVAGIVESKMALGLATDAELLRINTSRIQLQDQRDRLRQEVPAVSIALATAIGRRGGDELPLPLPGVLPPAVPARDQINSLIEAANPSLRMADHRIESLRHQEAVARKSGRPTFMLGLEYMYNRRERGMGDEPSLETLAAVNRLGEFAAGASNPMPMDVFMDAADVFMARREAGRREDFNRDTVMLSVTMSLPIYRHRVRAGIAEARAMQRAVEHERHSQLLALEAEAAGALFRMQDGSRRYALYESALLPQAEMTIDSVTQQYAADAYGISFIDVLDTVQSLLEFDLEKAMALRDWWLGAAELQLLTGGEPLHALPPAGEDVEAEAELSPHPPDDAVSPLSDDGGGADESAGPAHAHDAHP